MWFDVKAQLLSLCAVPHACTQTLLFEDEILVRHSRPALLLEDEIGGGVSFLLLPNSSFNLVPLLF